EPAPMKAAAEAAEAVAAPPPAAAPPGRRIVGVAVPVAPIPVVGITIPAIPGVIRIAKILRLGRRRHAAGRQDARRQNRDCGHGAPEPESLAEERHRKLHSRGKVSSLFIIEY